MASDTHYFLSANSAHGFTSLGDEILKEESTKLTYIIKGGSRGAKQAFFKALGDKAGAAGLALEQLQSASAPELLEGLSLPELGLFFLDGTKPLVFEPEHPCIKTKYISLDRFLDYKALSLRKEDVKALYEECLAFEEKAFRYLAAVEMIGRNIFSDLFSESIAEIIKRRAAGICAREFSDAGTRGSLQKRFISAFTYEGTISRYDTVNALCSRVCIIDNEFGFAPFMLRLLLDGALKGGNNVIYCPCPLYPDLPAHLLIPELSLAFVSVTPDTAYNFESCKHVRLDALADRERYKELKPGLREDERILELLLEKARQNLLFSKCSSDKLDEIVAPHVDLDGVFYQAEKCADEVFVI